MKLPRDLSGPVLIRHLAKLGYAVTRQAGSHVRLTTQERGEHHITIPTHDPLRIGTLAAILAAVATHKLARMVYFMLTRGEDFVDQGQQRYEEQQRQWSIAALNRRAAALKRRAAALGFDINPTPAPA